MKRTLTDFFLTIIWIYIYIFPPISHKVCASFNKMIWQPRSQAFVELENSCWGPECEWMTKRWPKQRNVITDFRGVLHKYIPHICVRCLYIPHKNGICFLCDWNIEKEDFGPAYCETDMYGTLIEITRSIIQ